MMKAVVAIILAAFVVAATATDCDELTIIKVRSQWYRAYSHGHSREHFAEAIFRTFFNLEPEAIKAYEKFGSDDLSSGKFRAHALSALAHVDLAVAFLGKPEPLAAALNYAHRQHEKRNAPDAYVTSFLKAIGTVAPAQLGRCFDKEAWKACFTVIGRGIRDGVPEIAHA